MGTLNYPMAEIQTVDPDRQARAVVHLIFEKYDELGTIPALFYWMIENGISHPSRPLCWCETRGTFY